MALFREAFQMLQSFDVQGGPEAGRRNTPLLQQRLRALGLDGLFVPHEDEYQNEYVPPALDRLAWVSGFTGSAGAGVVLHDRALLVTDGRYRLQAESQTAGDLYDVQVVLQGAYAAGAAEWLVQRARGARIGYDPRLISPDTLKLLQERLGDAVRLEPVSPNPVDEAWGASRPPMPAAPVVPHPLAYAGEASSLKRRRLGEELGAQALAGALITAPASIAWLFNIRGGDVARTPLPLGAALLRADGAAELFLAPQKVSPTLLAWLGNEVAVRPEDDLEAALQAMRGARLRLDPASVSAWHIARAEAAGVQIVLGPDPAALPRARKNPVEAAGARAAHRRDGAALSRFLHWLAEAGADGGVDEITACRTLEAFRRQAPELRDLSFDSISGAGPNGAIIHYRVNEATNRVLEAGSLFLIDSGAQYPDGTTDVTRTVAIGAPSPDMQRAYTHVLKGHIALAMVRFPPGTPGRALDALARAPLWAAGMDYDHGTGHGVGSYLGVHEGPQRIAKFASETPLEPGMIVSNEPGFYKPGAWGIRIENLQLVSPASPIPGGDRPMLGFEILTLAPLERALILPALLTAQEHAWVDAYHARVRAEIGPQLKGPAQEWLHHACSPLSHT